MSAIEFDLEKLKGTLNVNSAAKSCGGYEEYFCRLNSFITESKLYLREYSADLLTSDANMLASFRADLKAMRRTLFSLGITGPMATLSELDDEAEHGGKNLEFGLDQFFREIEAVADLVASAKIGGEEEPDEAPKDAPERAERPLILAADDKPELLTAVVNMLEGRFRVMAVTSGKAALKALEKHPPVLFLLDIEMPQMDGYELAEAIRKQERFAQTPILFLTSKNTREDVISAITRGGNDYLVKPVNQELLISKVMQHLGMA